LTDAKIRNIMYELLEAIAYCHQCGVIHRDIKCSNILIRDFVNLTGIVLADFGFACFLDDNEGLMKRCGTPGYTAPEILDRNICNFKCTTAIDMFSFGCVFYKVLTGKNLFGDIST